MKTKLTLVLAVVSCMAYADIGHKAPLKADFNALIVDTSKERKSLEHRVQDALDKKSHKIPDVALDEKDDSQRVTNFIDAEIHAGQKPAVVGGKSPTVVDRRFNSMAKSSVVLTEEDLKTLN